ncbi:unnamed protein product [Sphagnum balticum]
MKAHERTSSPVKQRKGVDKVNVGSPLKIPMALQKHKGKEKILKPMVELDEHINFHSLELSGDVNFLIAPLGAPRKEKGGKQTLERMVVDESPEKQEEEVPRVEKSSKEFLDFMDVFRVFVVQQGEVPTQNQKTTKLMNHIAKGLGAIGNTRSEGSTKATIKFKLRLDGRFTLHHLVPRDGMELLEFNQGDDRGSLATYIHDFNHMLTVVPFKDEYVRKLIFLHGLKPWV